MINIYQLPCQPYAGPGNCNADGVALVTKYWGDTIAALGPALALNHTGGFLTACVQHCHANIDACFNSAMVQGQNMHDTLFAWLQKTVWGQTPTHLSLVVDAPGLTNPTCTADCSPY